MSAHRCRSIIGSTLLSAAQLTLLLRVVAYQVGQRLVRGGLVPDNSNALIGRRYALRLRQLGVGYISCSVRDADVAD